MKKNVSKLFSMVLAFVLAFSMAMTGFAASDSSDDETFSITVTHAAAGENYSAYKIFDVTYSDEDGDGIASYSYTIEYSENNIWYPVVAEATNVFTLTQIEGTNIFNVTVKDGVADEAVIAVFTNADIDLSNVDPAATAKAVKTDPDDENSEAQAFLDVTASGPGYYYVTTTLGSLVIIDTTDPNVSVGEKNSFPTLSKWVHENTADEDTWQHEDDAGNGEFILFELEIDDINGAVNLVVHDSMDHELEIPDENDFHMRGVTLYMSKGSDGISLTEGTDYTVSIGECSVADCPLTGCAFEIHFLCSFDDVDSTGYIEITYELLLDTENDAYEDDYVEIDNYALLSYGIASFSAPVKAETYSFGFEAYKFTGEIVNDDNTGETDYGTPLANVEFEVRNSDGESAYFLEETVEDRTIYLFEGWGTPNENSGYTQTIISGSDGMVYIEGLDIDTYYLYETKAPDGYNALSGPVTVEIRATYDDDSGALLTHGVTYTYGDYAGSGVVNIQNNTGSTLPGTGGMGSTLFYIVGVVLIIGAVILFVTKKRLDKKDNNN